MKRYIKSSKDINIQEYLDRLVFSVSDNVSSRYDGVSLYTKNEFRSDSNNLVFGLTVYIPNPNGASDREDKIFKIPLKELSMKDNVMKEIYTDSVYVTNKVLSYLEKNYPDRYMSEYEAWEKGYGIRGDYT